MWFSRLDFDGYAASVLGWIVGGLVAWHSSLFEFFLKSSGVDVIGTGAGSVDFECRLEFTW